jgi:EmrB/QacA subfamily drug resistance transporter
VRRAAGPTVTIAVLGTAGIAYGLLGSAVVPALPVMKSDLHASESGIGWILTGYLLSASVGTAILGRLGDMYGKVRMLVWTLVLFAAGTLLAALAHTLALLIVARVIQGVAGGIFPLAFGIVRDEFPREKVAGSIGFLSGVMAMGAAAGIIAGALIVEHLGWQWLFWMPLAPIVLSAIGAWLLVPESPVRTSGSINWPAVVLMSVGMTASLIAITETTDWGWGSARTIGLLAAGLAVCALWVLVETRSREPLIDMAMMRIRGVATTNLAAFLLGVGMYATFTVFPQYAQLPTSTGFGFGASPVMSGVYLLPFTAGTITLSFLSGAVARRFGSRAAVIGGSAIAAVGFALTTFVHARPYEMMLTAALIGIGIGLAYAALGNLIVLAVEPRQTGAATGMNTVMRTLGGAIGAQLSATFVAAHTSGGYPTVTGFTDTYAMATGALLLCTFGALLIRHGRVGPPSRAQRPRTIRAVSGSRATAPEVTR